MAETLNRTSPRTPIRLFLLFALMLLGAGFSIYLTSHYYEIRSGATGFKSFCNIGEAMNCDAVAASPYAEALPGIPLSSLATGWYVGLLIVFMLSMANAWRKHALLAAAAMTGIAALASLYYFYVMAGVLHTYCLFCLFVDAINLGSFALTFSLWKGAYGRNAPEGESGGWKTIAGSVVVALFIAVVALKGMDTLTGHSAELDESANAILSSPPVAVNAGPEFPSIGPANAPVTIVEFSDFQCPFCRFGAIGLNTVLQRYPTQVRVVFRNYPLDQSCNRMVQHAMHQFACEAARAAVCAFKQGKFERYYQTVFEHQKDLGSGKPEEFALEAGVDKQPFEACVASPETGQAISRDVEEGTALRIESTPTFFVNGHPVMDGVKPLPVWIKVIEGLLKK